MKKKTKRIISLGLLIGAFVIYATLFSGMGGGFDDGNDAFEWKDTDAFYLDSYTIQEGNGFTDFAVIEDTIIAVSDSWSIARLINISDPINMYEIMDLDGSFENFIYSPVAAEDDTFIMAGAYGVERYDASDPTNLVYTGQLADVWGAAEIEILDGLIYHINYPFTNTFTVIDATADLSGGQDGVISNWTAPSNYILFEKMQIFEDIAVLAYSDGIMIVNISNPYNIQYLAEYETDLPRAMVKYGDVLYLSDQNGLKCLNISDYSDIKLIKAYDSTDYVFEDLEFQDGYAYGFRKFLETSEVSNNRERLICLDMRDPLNVEVIAENTDISCTQVEIHEDVLYLAGYCSKDGETFDYGDPDYGIISMRLFDSLNLSDTSIATVEEFDSVNNVEDVAVNGPLAYIADGEDGVSIIDISNVSQLEEVGAIDTAGNAMDVAVCGKTMFVADDDNGFSVYDASDPNDITLVDNYDAGGNSYSIDLKRSYACVAEGSAGISLVNVSDHYDITELSVFDTTGTAMDVDIYDGIAYVADLDGGLLCVNITDKTAPSQVGNLDVGSDAVNVFIADEKAYIATADAGLKIVNIEDPTNPSLLTTYTTAGEVNDVSIAGNTAFLNVKGYGLEAVNISDLASPVSIGYTASTGGQNGTCISGGYAFVANGASGLSVIKAIHMGNDDFDNDGLSYLEETWNWGSDTFDNDTDDDGIPDGYEAEHYFGVYLGESHGSYTGIMQILVADSSADIDYDELTNLEEYELGTDPFMADTDGDKVMDSVEVFDGTDPLDSSSFIQRTDPVLIVFAVVVVIAVVLTILSSMGVFTKRAPLNIFLSHAVIDFEKRHIQEMSEFLGSKESVNRGFYCEQDMKGNIDDWMDEMVPLSHIFVFIASEKSVHNSVDCGREIRLGNQYGLFMIPIRTEEVTWEDIENIGLPGKEKGLEYPTNAKGVPKELFEQLEEKISEIYENMKKLEKMLEDNDIADMATFDEALEIDSGDSARLARILIKNGDVKGALTSDGNQYISAAEITRQAKALLKQSEDKSIDMIMENLRLDPFYEHEVYDFLKKLLDKGKTDNKKERDLDEVQSEDAKSDTAENDDSDDPDETIETDEPI